MKKGFLSLITAMTFALLVPAFAQEAEPEEVAMARVVTSYEKITDCIARFAVTTIDGEQRKVPAGGFDIEAGTHSLNGAAAVNFEFCPVNRHHRERDGTPDLEADFVAGNTYYVGLDHNSRDVEDWRIIVWKVEDADGQVLELMERLEE